MKRFASLIFFFKIASCAIAQHSDFYSRETFMFLASGSMREAYVFRPAHISSADTCPLVFVFHGRGGTSESVSKRICIHELWPEAIVVYPQGLWTYGGIVGDGNGWVMPKVDNCGRDVDFFDEMFSLLADKYSIDKNRVYCVGYSNGGGFVQALWALRGDIFAAVASVHSGAGHVSEEILMLRRPKPAFFVAGASDEIVDYSHFLDFIYSTALLNGCDVKHVEADANLRYFQSSSGADVIAYLHSGGHSFPKEVLPYIVDFFKNHTLKK